MRTNYKTGSKPILKPLFATLLFAGGMATAQVTPTLLIPASGSNSLAMCSGSFIIQDHAGNNNYANNIDGNYVFYPGAGGTLTITGSYVTESCCDPINIYNGVGTGGTSLGQYQGTGTMSFVSTPGQTVTLRFRSDGSVVYSGLTFTVSYSGPCFYPACTSAPAANTVVATSTMICPWSNASTLSLQAPNALTGITYEFYESTAGPFGPFNAIPNTQGQYNFGPVNYVVSPNLAQNTWYMVTMSCINGGVTTTATPVGVSLGYTAVSTVPYFEGFEGISGAKDLPNCSWARSDNYQVGSQVGPINSWRMARTGTKFAEFDASNSVTGQTRYFYTNGILLNAGITYSASLWYATSGSSTWNNLTILYGSTQTPSGLNSIATVANATSQSYQPLGNTFMVATTGTYYIAVRAQENYYSSQLVWDDLSITAPCQFTNNAASINVSGPLNVCAGQTVNLLASGANSYTWTGGPNTASFAVSPSANVVYTVSGVNPLSGCVGVATRMLFVNPAPPVSIVALQQSVCEGKPVTMVATGANSYTWSQGPTLNPVLTATPTTANNSYTVIGSNSFGCQASAVQQIAVNPNPVISVTGNTLICSLNSANLSASGAGSNGSYEWQSNVVYLGSQVALSPTVTTTYIVRGTDANGCKGETQLVVAVDPCVGIADINGRTAQIRVYPNPNNGTFHIVTADASAKTIEVSEVTGRIVLSENTSSQAVQVDISTMANGVYYVKVVSSSSTDVVKIIKN